MKNGFKLEVLVAKLVVTEKFCNYLLGAEVEIYKDRELTF